MNLYVSGCFSLTRKEERRGDELISFCVLLDLLPQS